MLLTPTCSEMQIGQCTTAYASIAPRVPEIDVATDPKLMLRSPIELSRSRYRRILSPPLYLAVDPSGLARFSV